MQIFDICTIIIVLNIEGSMVIVRPNKFARNKKYRFITIFITGIFIGSAVMNYYYTTTNNSLIALSNNVYLLY